MNSAKALDVWIVDDDASIRWVLERALKQAGLETRAFEQADAALAALREATPDVLVTDIRMPGRSGLEMLEEIRAKRPRLPVIVMTAHSDLESAVAAGMAMDRDELWHRIDGIVVSHFEKDSRR